MNHSRSNADSTTPLLDAILQDDYFERLAREAAQEEAAFAEVRRLAAEIAEAARPVWGIGDGEGGYVHALLDEALREAGLGKTPRPGPKQYRKAPIPVALRWEVWERDDFTCQADFCGARRDLTVDHVLAESKGGPTTLDNLQTLCRPCNVRKGTR